MHSWFTQKLNELTAVAHYCQFPIMEAHFILSQTAVNDVFDSQKQNDVPLERLLSLMVMQAENIGKSDVALHLQDALDALSEMAVEDQATENVIAVDFHPTHDVPNRFGA